MQKSNDAKAGPQGMYGKCVRSNCVTALFLCKSAIILTFFLRPFREIDEDEWSDYVLRNSSQSSLLFPLG
jgi:hypothetical protein